MEIERKFLTDGFPEGLPELLRADVRQGYLCTRPVVRIRSTRTDDGVRYVLCIKGPGTLARKEIELDLPEDKFRELQTLLPMPMIRKDYRVFALPGGLRLECSRVDDGEPGSFSYAEVEFESVEAARAFEPPAFLGREVTEQPGYSMGNYWENNLLRLAGKE